MTPIPVTQAQLEAALAEAGPSPRERGRIEKLCVRPDLNQRLFPDRLEITRQRGAIGDRWERRTWMYLPDGRPDPRVQVAICNSRIIAAIQSLTGETLHPGDTLMADLDLGEDNLPVGALLRAGTVLLRVSDVENDACAKFAQRHGAEVLAWIRRPENRTRRLRGLFASVVEDGEVHAGDMLEKIARG